MSNLVHNFTSSINKSFTKHSESIAAYRFLSNKRVTEKDLIKRLRSSVTSSACSKKVLVLCDTTEYNLHNHRRRITDFTGLGSTSLNDIIGFFSHNQLVVDRDKPQILGWADVHLYNRPVDNEPFVRPNYSVPISEKESNKWLEPSLMTRDKVLHHAEHSLYVMDREADIYEVLSSLPNHKCDYLIRAKHNRRVKTLHNKKSKLKEDLLSREVKGSLYIQVNGDGKRTKHLAKCQLRYEEYIIERPSKIHQGTTFPDSIKATAISIKETATTPINEQPIEWILWTSEKVDDPGKAIELMNCYVKRWTIEEAHRLLKIKGFNMEASELENGTSLRKLLILGMEASVKVMQLKSARTGETEYKTKEVFEDTEIEFLELLNKNLQGNTEKLSNSHNKHNLAWASWIIARMGGWKGYASQRPPGTITFKRGLDIFYQQLSGYRIAKMI